MWRKERVWGDRPLKESRDESENRKEGLVTHEELPSRCVEVEYAVVTPRRENDLMVVQGHEFCLCRLARARADACWRPDRDSIVASGKVE